MKVKFAKLFRNTKEGKIYKPSIIAFHFGPWEVKNNKIVKNRHWLYINLWLVELEFKWITTSAF